MNLRIKEYSRFSEWWLISNQIWTYFIEDKEKRKRGNASSAFNIIKVRIIDVLYLPTSLIVPLHSHYIKKHVMYPKSLSHCILIILRVCFTRVGILNWCAISCQQFLGKFLENSAQILYRQLFWVATKLPPWRVIPYTTMPSFIKFGSALQSLFPYYGHVIRSMEITAEVFDRISWNLAWLYIESIFRVEIRLQLEIINGTKFKPNLQTISRGIIGNLWHINSEFPGG